MNTLNRLLVVFSALLCGVAALAVLAAGLGLLAPDRLPVGYWLQEGLSLLTTPGRAERLPGLLIALGILGLSLTLLWLEWRSVNRADHPILVSSSPSGDITLARAGVRRLAEHAATQVDGVLEARARVHGGGRLNVSCNASITPDTHAPTVAAEVRERLKDAIERHVGRPVDRVSVHTQLDPLTRGVITTPRVR